MLQFGWKSSDGAAAVGFHIREDAAVTEDKAGGGQHCGVGTRLPAQRTAPTVSAQLGVLTVVLLQVEGGWRSRQGGESFHHALVVRGVPPLQEL